MDKHAVLNMHVGLVAAVHLFLLPLTLYFLTKQELIMKIDFEFDSTYGVFRDALHLPEDHNFTYAEIQAMKQQRFDNWWAAVNAPPAESDVEATPTPAASINIAGEDYVLLEGTPVSGAKLLEVNGTWYVKA